MLGAPDVGRGRSIAAHVRPPHSPRCSPGAYYLPAVGVIEDYRKSMSNRVLLGKTEQDFLVEPVTGDLQNLAGFQLPDRW